MPSFGKVSRRNLGQCHPDLIRLAEEAIKYVDFSITCGHRGQKEQDLAVKKGRSKTPWPTSKHNATPAQAFDFAPYPRNWQDEESFTLLAGVLMGIAKTMGIDVRIGADWDGDFNLLEHSFMDRPHLELK